MTAAIYNFDTDQGATFRASITLRVSQTKDPLDLEGFDVRFLVKPIESDEVTRYSAVIEKDPNTDLNTNVVTISLTPLQTDVLGIRQSVRSLNYEVLIDAPSGDIKKVLKGNINIIGSF